MERVSEAVNLRLYQLLDFLEFSETMKQQIMQVVRTVIQRIGEQNNTVNTQQNTTVKNQVAHEYKQLDASKLNEEKDMFSQELLLNAKKIHHFPTCGGKFYLSDESFALTVQQKFLKKTTNIESTEIHRKVIKALGVDVYDSKLKESKNITTYKYKCPLSNALATVRFSHSYYFMHGSKQINVDAYCFHSQDYNRQYSALSQQQKFSQYIVKNTKNYLDTVIAKTISFVPLKFHLPVVANRFSLYISQKLKNPNLMRCVHKVIVAISTIALNMLFYMYLLQVKLILAIGVSIIAFGVVSFISYVYKSINSIVNDINRRNQLENQDRIFEQNIQHINTFNAVSSFAVGFLFAATLAAASVTLIQAYCFFKICVKAPCQFVSKMHQAYINYDE